LAIELATCEVSWCDRSVKTRGLCMSHYARLMRGKDLDPPFRDNARRKVCVSCGATDWPDSPNWRLRDYCSPACLQLYHRNGRTPPKSVACIRCGKSIDLFARGKSGRKRRADVKLCATCKKAKYLRHGMSVNELAARDGFDCGICGDPVNMGARYPDPSGPSVDHVLPVARGGSNDPRNLQLAHLRCNHVKSSRTAGEFSPSVLMTGLGGRRRGN